MTFSVIIHEGIVKKLKKYPSGLRNKLIRKLEQLENFPEGLDVKKIGEITYRIRVGEFRIIIDIYFDKRTIQVVKLDVRGRVY